jgi:two-component system, NtrC family, sensor kinase
VHNRSISGDGRLRDLKTQFVSALLFVLTVAAVCCALVNFRQQTSYHLPDDGVTWVDRTGGDGQNLVLALHVTPGSQGYNAGIRSGDVLLEVAGHAIVKTVDVPQALQQVGIWNKTEYMVRRDNVPVPAQVIVGEGVLDRSLYYQYAVGIAYLLIGLFVYYRRVGAPRSVHFYVLCLTSFILSCFHFTGKLNAFDQAIYWGNVVAGVLAPTIFLHFCLVFPERPKWLERPGLSAVFYLPGAFLLTLYLLVAKGILRVTASPVEVNWFLDRVWLLFLSAFYLAGSLVLAMKTPHAEDPLVRRQLKYLRNGALLGVVPFTLIYAVPYLFGALPGHYQKMAVLSMILMPLTWAYAILRYRLMDVDIIFQQGYVYTLATLVVLGIFYGLIFSFARPEDLSPAAIVGLILFATFIFQPIRDWLQEQLDRYFFYKDRYDYRRTLIEFARELGSETDLDEMLRSVADRLLHTLSIQHVAFFLANEPAGESGEFRLHMTLGNRKERVQKQGPELDLSFLSEQPGKPYLFFERTRHLLDAVSHDWPISVRRAIADLDLTYYFPCTVRGRTIAYLALSRTDKGDFLSSDDVELLTTLAGYVSIAVENTRLYRSLQHKMEEYERLKEFSENIVESINVGILAVDLNDCVESWNTQIERLTGIPRDAALGRRLAELFPAELSKEFDQVRGQTGVHNIYKFVLQGPAGLTPRNANGNGNGKGNGSGAHTLNLAIAPLVAKDLQQIGRLIIFDDVTDRDELERQLVQADKLSSIGLLAAGVAHEVNTPLAVISTYAQMLAKQISEDEQKSKLLDKIAKQTFRASEIVNSLLSFSRTSTTEFVELDVGKVIQETLNLVEHQLRKSAIEVKLDTQPALPPVKGNSGKLQQVFLNLFLNARDAMETGGTLAIRVWSEDGFARIDVADSGQGIQPENLARIYDPFFTTKAARKGTGLGLSVTYGIVREHGGTIEVESHPGAGSRFRVELPLARKPVHA